MFGHQLFAQLSPGKLSKAHAELEGLTNCTQCHTLGKQVTNQKCLDCHKEIDALIKADHGFHVSSEVEGESCVKCHSEHHGTGFNSAKFDEEKFDHNLTGYELLGQHDVIECRDCHKVDFIADSEIKKLEGTFLGMDQACLLCHDDFHQETLGNQCIDCHGFDEWRPAPGFDHNNADFQLKGAHVEVDCKECHKMTVKNGLEYQEFVGLKFNECIDCHKDVHEGKFGTNCLECHNENTFKIAGNILDFDHNLTGYPLEGRHISVECKECHTSGDFTKPMKYGLCRDCHDDYHNGEFAEAGVNPDCKQCHTLEQPFDYTIYGLEEHLVSNFPLDGSHIATPCFACHVSEEKWSFRNIGSACIDCHDDIHDGMMDAKFYEQKNCTACHNTVAWSEVTFDHNTTDWALEGRHSELACRSCHFSDLPSLYVSTQRFNTLTGACNECHENVHGTQFGEEGTVTCTKCHTTSEVWNVANFNHDETLFPLVGEHAKVDCKACHQPILQEDGSEFVEYKLKKFECVDCHS